LDVERAFGWVASEERREEKRRGEKR